MYVPHEYICLNQIEHRPAEFQAYPPKGPSSNKKNIREEITA
jgi:hypothetical protein